MSFIALIDEVTTLIRLPNYIKNSNNLPFILKKELKEFYIKSICNVIKIWITIKKRVHRRENETMY